VQLAISLCRPRIPDFRRCLMMNEESKESIILSSVANYQTVNILELMSLTPGLDDVEVRQTVDAMEKNDLVNVKGAGDDQFVSVTDKGYSYLSSLQKFA
jgi:predicted transcriptional regulator